MVTDGRVGAWLRYAGLSRFSPRFEAALINASSFLTLSSADLDALGVDGPADRKRLTDLIADLKRNPNTFKTAPIATTNNNNNTLSNNILPDRHRPKTSTHLKQQQQQQQTFPPRPHPIARRQSSVLNSSSSNSSRTQHNHISSYRPKVRASTASVTPNHTGTNIQSSKSSYSLLAHTPAPTGAPTPTIPTPASSTTNNTTTTTMASYMTSSPPSATVTVCVRKRPLSRKEIHSRDRDIVTVTHEDGRLCVHELKEKVDLTKYIDTHEFTFDNVFDEHVGNEAVYDGTAKPLVDTLFSGGRGTCFAYGQTGAGKTFTMAGDGEENPGLYTLVIRDIFDRIREIEKQAWIKAEEQGILDHFEPPDPPEIWISFYEIYGTRLQDLLNKGVKLECREDANNEVQIVGLTEKLCEIEEDVLDLIQLGSSLRSTGITGANDDSSRSHAVFQIGLRQPPSKFIRKDKNTIMRESLLQNTIKKNQLRNSNVNKGEEIGRLCFIDLAGSERGSDTASNTRQTRMEGAEINKSLLALKECIRAMDKRKDHTPFRGSKLTQVLKASFLGKNCRTVMIANISPASSNCEHTLNTLRYSDRVKEIKKERSGNSNGNTLNNRRTTLGHGNAATFSHGLGGTSRSNIARNNTIINHNNTTFPSTASDLIDGFDEVISNSMSGNFLSSKPERNKTSSRFPRVDSNMKDTHIDMDDGHASRSSSFVKSSTTRRLTKSKAVRSSEYNNMASSYPAALASSTTTTTTTTIDKIDGNTLKIQSSNDSGNKESKLFRRRVSKAPLENNVSNNNNNNASSRANGLSISMLPRIPGKNNPSSNNLLSGRLKLNGNNNNGLKTPTSVSNNNQLDDTDMISVTPGGNLNIGRQGRHREKGSMSTNPIQRDTSPVMTRQRARELDRRKEEEIKSDRAMSPSDSNDIDTDVDIDPTNVNDDSYSDNDDDDNNSDNNNGSGNESRRRRNGGVRPSNVAESAMKYYMGRSNRKDEFEDEDLLFMNSADDLTTVMEDVAPLESKTSPNKHTNTKKITKVSKKSGMKLASSAEEVQLSSHKDNNSKNHKSSSNISNSKNEKKKLSPEIKQVIRLHHMQIEELMRLTEADVAMVNSIEKGELDAQEYALKLSVNLSQKLDIIKTLQNKVKILD